MKRKKTKSKSNDSIFFNNSMTKILLCIIIILISLIFTNYSSKNKNYYKKNFLEKSINYSTVNKIYNKYFGKLPTTSPQEILTFNENSIYQDITKYENGYKVKVNSNLSLPFLASGLIVFIGEKDNLPNTVIVQGNDGVDIWYSNVTLENHSLYDYVSNGAILGKSLSNEIILHFVKDNQYLTYENYIK